MNEQTAKQLVRQLKIINFWISFYGVILIVIMGTLAFMMFQVVTFVRETNERIDALRTSAVESIDVQKKICQGDDEISGLIKRQTDLCR